MKTQQNKFLRIITTPVRALSKARDLYVKSITNYAVQMNHGGFVAAPGASRPGLPRSFSTDSARAYESEDFRELVRASSARSMISRVDYDMYMNQKLKTKTGPVGGARAMPPRSSSVAMGRIDEERPCCYFAEDHYNISSVKNEMAKYPRSKSHAAVTRGAF